jgi:SOS-response transcriptional repressor LexA
MTAGEGALVCPKCGHVIAEAKPRALSKRQAEILDFVQRSIDEKHFAPTFEEIAIHFGLKSLASVHEHLDTLEEKGWIRRRFNASRSIELLHRLPNDPSGGSE